MYVSLQSISTIGIMFDVVGIDTPFPRLSDMPYSWVGESVPESADVDGIDIGSWFVVATNPSRIRYFDDDSEAMDETNFDAIFGADVESVYWLSRGYTHPYELQGVPEAVEAGVATFGRVVIVDPDRDDIVESMLSYSRALSDYPILDDGEYSRREHEAWCSWASTGGLQSDTIRELSEAGWDPDVIARIDAQWDHVWPNMSSWLDYYHGFTGESSDVPEAITRAMAAGDIVLNYVEAVDVDYVS